MSTIMIGDEVSELATDRSLSDCVGEEEIEPRRVLVVDDNRSHLSLLQVLLDWIPDLQVSYATTGKDAVELLRTCKYGLLMTDFRMPGMDGIDLASIAKGLSPKMEIILVTADILSQDMLTRVASAGIDKVLTKPVRINEILSIVARYQS